MTLLLDTHVLLWAAADSPRLPAGARALLLDRQNTLRFSSVSLWEVAIKLQLGRADFQVDLVQLRRGLAANGYLELAVGGEHALELLRLPDLHRDPFDRMLVAQARVEGHTLLTSDEAVASYGAPVRLA